MDSMLAVLHFFSADGLYGIFEEIKSSMLWLSPIFLVGGFGAIVFEQSSNAISSKVNFQEAAAGTILPMIFLTMYIFMGAGVYSIAHNLKAATRDTGSFEKMAENYQKTLKKIDDNKIIKQDEEDWIDKTISVVENTLVLPNLLEFVTRMLFLLTFLIVVFAEIAVEFALAVVILFIYAYGFVAIPTANKTKSFSFGEGWWRLFIAMIFYLIISSLLFLILEKYVANSSIPEELKTGEIRDFSATRISLYVIYSFSNALIIGIDVVSIWAAAALSRNQDALMPIMAPLVGAGAMFGKMLGESTIGKAMSYSGSKLKPVGSRLLSDGMTSLKDSIRNGLGGMGNAANNATDLGGMGGGHSDSSGGNMSNDFSGGESRGTTSSHNESAQNHSFETQEAEPETFTSDSYNDNSEVPKNHDYASAEASFERLKDTSWANGETGDKNL